MKYTPHPEDTRPMLDRAAGWRTIELAAKIAAEGNENYAAGLFVSAIPALMMPGGIDNTEHGITAALETLASVVDRFSCKVCGRHIPGALPEQHHPDCPVK